MCIRDSYNALVSGAECRACRGEDGLPVYFTFNFIPITSAEQLTEMSGWDEMCIRDSGMIVQEAGTIANISVAENIFLGNYDKFKKLSLIHI